eukprot:6216954-Alexandrium_andersonii.AAC.1
MCIRDRYSNTASSLQQLRAVSSLFEQSPARPLRAVGGYRPPEPPSKRRKRCWWGGSPPGEDEQETARKGSE